MGVNITPATDSSVSTTAGDEKFQQMAFYAQDNSMKRGTFIGDQVLIKKGPQQLAADLRSQKTAKSRAQSSSQY
ncbi:MAG: hypothetical protein ACE10C_08235 [Candidatus Binatia bacterium]